MYQPISFNVIRQALEWHKIPVPALRQLSFYDCFEDFVSAEYLATWNVGDIITAGHGHLERDGDAPYSRFINALRDAFCEDVTVTQMSVNSLKGLVTAVLYVTISREVIIAAQGLTWVD